MEFMGTFIWNRIENAVRNAMQTGLCEEWDGEYSEEGNLGNTAIVHVTIMRNFGPQ